MTVTRGALARSLPGLVVVAGAIALLAWPLHGNGLSGSALRPHYSDFGWFAYGPLPEHPTTAELRQAGVTVPQDLVARRRRLAAGVALVGLVLVAGGVALGHRQGS